MATCRISIHIEISVPQGEACFKRQLAISESGCLLNRLKASSLEAMHLTKEATDNVSLLDHFDKIMPAKKTHEVARMYTAVVEGARKTGCSAVVDLGSGKGYLSQVGECS